MQRNWQIASRAIVCLTIGLLGITTGCNQSSSSSQAKGSGEYQPETDAGGNNDASVVRPSNAEATSPATGQIDSSSSPEAVVEQFILALNQGDASSAEKLLTETAQVATRQHNLVVQQPWSPSASYQIEFVRYATTRSQRAEVDSIWKDAEGVDNNEEFTIVWMLYREEHYGWRISGMKSDFIPNGDMVYLNFEDPVDMVNRWEQALLDADKRTEAIRNANNGNTTNR